MMIGKPTYKTEDDFQLSMIGTGASVDLLAYTLIPSNRCGVMPGYYDHAALVKLIRSAAMRPTAVRFIADMME